MTKIDVDALDGILHPYRVIMHPHRLIMSMHPVIMHLHLTRMGVLNLQQVCAHGDKRGRRTVHMIQSTKQFLTRRFGGIDQR